MSFDLGKHLQTEKARSALCCFESNDTKNLAECLEDPSMEYEGLAVTTNFSFFHYCISLMTSSINFDISHFWIFVLNISLLIAVHAYILLTSSLVSPELRIVISSGLLTAQFIKMIATLKIPDTYYKYRNRDRPAPRSNTELEEQLTNYHQDVLLYIVSVPYENNIYIKCSHLTNLHLWANIGGTLYFLVVIFCLQMRTEVIEEENEIILETFHEFPVYETAGIANVIVWQFLTNLNFVFGKPVAIFSTHMEPMHLYRQNCDDEEDAETDVELDENENEIIDFNLDE